MPTDSLLRVLLHGLGTRLSAAGARIAVGCALGILSLSAVAAAGAEASTPAAKQPICGLLTMGAINEVKQGGFPDPLREAKIHPDIYAGVVLLASWKFLEPQRGRYEFAGIDQRLQAITAYNTAHPSRPLAAKLRIFAGVNAPQWAKALEGGPLAVHSERNEPIFIGLFWSDSYRAAWKELQRALAARYDAHSLVREVAVSSCCTLSGEPFIAPLNPQSLPVLKKAGFTDAKYKAALWGALEDYAPWQRTPLDFTFNQFRNVDSGKVVPDADFTVKLMKAFRQRYGRRGVIANHGLVDPLRPAALEVYQAIDQLGPPVEFQTFAPNVDFDKAVALALRYRATEIELWESREAGGYAPITAEMLQRWAKMLDQRRAPHDSSAQQGNGDKP